ncbi:hypothetical protein GW832_01920, partial [bacterium]|nr:hypothetical protein [bacterium]
MRYPAFKPIVASGLIFGLLFSYLPAQATVYDVSGIPPKNTGDAITAAEVNLMVDMLRNLKKDDRGDTDTSNDRLGIGIAGTPGYMLDVNGTVNAAAFRGDGSQLTNLPNPGAWQITANDIYYNAGKVAIGINSSPTYQLEVHAAGDSAIQVNAGGSGNDATLRLKNDSQEWIIRNNGGAGDNFQINNVTTGTTAIDVDSTSNNVTIANELTVNNDITTTGIIYAAEFYDTDTGTPIGGAAGLWEEGAEVDEIYYDEGNVGIGTANPAYPLQVSGDVKLDDHLAVGGSATVNTDRVAYIDENFSNDNNNYLLMVQGTAAGSTTGTKNFYGGYIDAETTQTESSGNAYTQGLYSRARSNGTATFNTLRGLNGTAYNDSSAGSGLGNLMGVSGEAYNNDSVAGVSAAYGGYFTGRGRSTGPAGSIANLYGMRSEASAYESEITNAYGAYNIARTVNGDGGSITTAYGSYNNVEVDSAAGGDITTGYGVYSDLGGRAGSTQFTNATGIYSDVNNALTAYAGRFYADDPTANLNYGLVIGASGATNNYGIFGIDGDWVLDADGDGNLGGTGSDLIIGEDGDLRIYHNGTNSVIDNRTGNLNLIGSNVGIGTSNAALPLTVVGTGVTVPVGGLNFNAVSIFSNTDNGAGIVLGGETTEGDGFIVSNTDGSDLIFANNFLGVGAAEALRIASNGSIGVGDSTPDGTLKLDVAGQIGATEYCDANGANCTAAGDLGGGLWTENGTSVFYNSGRVGIGTNVPSSALTVVEGTVPSQPNTGGAVISVGKNGDAFIGVDSTDNAGKSGISFWGAGDRGSVYGNSSYDIVIEPNAQFGGGDVIMNAKGGTTMNVGIGTTSPAEELYLTKTQANPTTMVVQNSSADTGANVRSGVTLASNGAQLDLALYGTGASGTLSGESKSDAAYIRTTNGAPVSSLNIGNGGSAPINFFTGDTKRVTIGNDGKFGIGAPSPTSSLTILNTTDDNGFNMETVNGRVYQSYASGQNRILIGEKNGGAGSAGLYLNGNDGDISGSDYAAMVHSGTTGDLTLTTTSNSGTWANADIILAPAGNVGIGIGTISAGLKLEVGGRIGATEYCDANGANCTAAGALGSGYWSKSVTDDVYYNGGEVGVGISNPSEELVVNGAQTDPTTIAIQNSSSAASATVRAGLALQSNGNTVDLMTYGTGATGTIGGQNRADSAFLRTASTNPVNTLNLGTGAANDLNLFTNDTTRLTVDGSTGNIGIGTTSPLTPLQISGTAGGLESGTATPNGYMGLGPSTSGGADVMLTMGANPVPPGFHSWIQSRSASSTTVYPLALNPSGGNVGIGTYGPSEELHVFQSQANPTTVAVGNTSTSANTNTRSGFTTASNGAQLDIVTYGSNATGTSGGQNRADSAVIRTGTTLAPSSLNVGTGGTQDVNLFTNDTTRMTVDGTTGNVGIGTTTPDGTLLLDVAGRVGATEYCDENGNNCTAAGALGTGYWSKTGDDVWYAPGATGEVGIGLSNPSEELVVSRNQASPTTVAALNSSASNNTNTRAGFTAQSNAAAMDMMVYSSAATGAIGGQNKADAAFVRTSSSAPVSSLNMGTGAANDVNLFTADTTRLTIDGTTGNVGIGTANPRSMLDINGTSDFITLGTDAGQVGEPANNPAMKIGEFSDVGSGSDIWFDDAALLSAEDSLNINIDGDASTAGAATFTIGANSLTNTANELFRVEETGDVGIGTAGNAESMLHISGSAANVQITDTDTGADFMVLTNSTVGGAILSADRNSEVASSYLDLSVDGATHLRVTETGNVGIGDTTPDGSLKLDVEGRVGATEYCDANGANCLTAGSLGGKWLDGVGANEIYYSAADVGIGTDAPVTRLHIVDTGAEVLRVQRSGSSADAAMAFVNDTNSMYAGISNAEEFGIGTSNNIDAALLTVERNGEVGMGTVNPSEELHVFNSQANPTTIVAGNTSTSTDTNTRAGFTAAANGGQLDIYHSGSAATGSVGDQTKADAAVIKTLTGAPSSKMIIGTGGAAPLNLMTNDLTRMTVAANGNVGIGNTSPGAQLHIGSSSNTLGTTAGNDITLLRLESDSANTDSLMFTSERISNGSDWTTAAQRIQRLVDSTSMGYMQMGNAGSDLITFGENNTEYMRIDGSGNVGIGDTTPNGSLKLDVEGAIGATQYCDQNGANCTLATELGSGYWSKTGDDVWYNPGATGEVGIGLSNPTEELVVNRAANNAPTTIAVQNSSAGTGTNTRAGFTAASNGAQVDIMAYGSAATGTMGGVNKADAAIIRTGTTLAPSSLNVGTGAAQDVNLFTNDITRLTVDGSTGNVGIGTTNPDNNLEVVGSLKAKLAVANNTGIYLGSDATNRPKLGFRASDDSERFKMQFEGVNTAVERLAVTKSSGGSAEVMSVLANGGVGIGINSPSEELHVFNSQANPTTIVAGNTSTSTNTNTRAGFTAAANGGQIDIYHMSSGATGSVGDQTKADAAVIKTLTGAPSSKMIIGTGGAAPLNLMTNDLTRMTILDNGNVGIGNTSPGRALEVSGDIESTGDHYWGDGKRLFRFNDAWLRMNPNNEFTTGIYAGTGVFRTDGEFQVGGTNGGDFVVETSGEVGIGNINPAAPLDIVSAQPNILLADSDTGADAGFLANSGVGGVQIAADLNSEVAGSYVDLSVDGATHLRVTETGNVGIGDTTPDGSLKLDVEGRVGATEYCDANGANCQTAGALGGKWLDGVGANEIYYSAAKVGIGTNNPAHLFHTYHATVNAQAFFESGDTTANIGIGDSTGSVMLLTTGDGDLRFYVGGDAGTMGTSSIIAQTILDTGEIGMGTAGPTEELHVFKSQANPTTIVAGNTSASTNTNTRAGFTAAANGGQLDIYHSSSAATGSVGDQTKADAAVIKTLTGAPSSKMIIGTGGAAPLNLMTNDLTRMTVATDGNVGIGTAPTTARASIEAAGNSVLNLNLTGASADTVLQLDSSDGVIAAGSKFISATDGAKEVFAMNGNGNMTVNANGTIGGSNIASSWLRFDDGSFSLGIDSNEIYSDGTALNIGTIGSYDINFQTNGGLSMRIEAGGAVGIGT